MSELVSLYLVLWVLASPNVVTHEVDGPVRFIDLYGVEREAPGALACPSGGAAQLWLSDDAGLEVVVHELAHAFDCVDDGELNGSPGPMRSARPEWVSDYCWSSEAELYACWVVHGGRVIAAPPAEVAGAPPPLAGQAPASAAPLAAAPAPRGSATAGGTVCQLLLRWAPRPGLLAIGTGTLGVLVEPAGTC